MRRAASVAAMVLSAALAGCVSSGGNPQGPTAHASPRLAARYNTELAIDYMREGRMDLAQRKLALALKQAPHMPEVHNALALYYERIGEIDNADHQYRLSLQYAPGNPSTLNNYGAFLCRQGRYRKSLNYFTRAAENLNYGTPDAALTNAGLCALRIPDKKLARRYFERALAINPEMNQALWQLGLMDFEAGQYSSADAHLSHLIATMSDPSARVLWVGIETAWALGNRKEVEQYGRELLKRHPDSAEARKFIKLVGSEP